MAVPVEHFAFTDQGIVVKYDTYQIAPYSYGQPELLIPYSELDGALRVDYLPLTRPEDRCAFLDERVHRLVVVFGVMRQRTVGGSQLQRRGERRALCSRGSRGQAQAARRCAAMRRAMARASSQRVVRHHPVHQPQLQCALRIDHVSGEHHFQRLSP